MKIAEIKEMNAAELAERIQTEQANYNQMLLNHAVSPLENNSQIKIARRNIPDFRKRIWDFSSDLALCYSQIQSNPI